MLRFIIKYVYYIEDFMSYANQRLLLKSEKEEYLAAGVICVKIIKVGLHVHLSLKHLTFLGRRVG